MLLICGVIRTFIHCWWGYKMVHPLWKIVWRFLLKLNIYLPYDLAILFLGIYPREMKTCSQGDMCRNAHNSFTHNDPELETIQIYKNKRSD